MRMTCSPKGLSGKSGTYLWYNSSIRYLFSVGSPKYSCAAVTALYAPNIALGLESVCRPHRKRSQAPAQREGTGTGGRNSSGSSPYSVKWYAFKSNMVVENGE